MPFGYGCSVQSVTVNLANGATASATLTLKPTATPAAVTGKAVRPRRSIIGLWQRGPNRLWPVSLLSGLAALLFLGMARKQGYLQVSLGLCLVGILSAVIGCGGGGGGSGGGGGAGGSGGGGATVGPFATTTTLSTSAAKVATGATITFTAKVTGPGNPTGTVDFCLNNYCGTGTLVSGTATWSTSVDWPGLYSLTAEYGGDTQNLNSTSGIVSQAVTGSIVLNVAGQTGVLFHSSNVTVTLQ